MLAAVSADGDGRAVSGWGSGAVVSTALHREVLSLQPLLPAQHLQG